MVEEDKNVQTENELNQLWLEAEEMDSKWKSEIIRLVEGDTGLHPWNSRKKVRNKDGRLINIRTFEGDDNLDNCYHTLEFELNGWNSKIDSWLSNVPPRFRRRFDETFTKAERFSKRFDEQYSYEGDVSMLLELYDDFCKKRAAIEDLWGKFGSDGWSVKEDDDVAFELKYYEMGGDLYIKYANNEYKVHHFRLNGGFEETFSCALDDSNRAHKVEIDTDIIDTEHLQTSIGMLKIPRKLRTLMIKTAKGHLLVNPQITHGDLRREGIDDNEIVGELQKLPRRPFKDLN